MHKNFKPSRKFRFSDLIRGSDDSNIEANKYHSMLQNRTPNPPLILLSLLIYAGVSCFFLGCNNKQNAPEATAKATTLFDGEILSALSEDASLVGRMMASSAPGKKFLLTRSSFSKSISEDSLRTAGAGPFVGGPIGESLKLGELNEIVEAVDDQGKLKEDLADLAFAVVPIKSGHKDTANNGQSAPADSANPLAVEVVAKFKDNSAKSRVERIVKALQQKGRSIKQLAFDGCDSSVSFAQQLEMTTPSQQLAADTELPNKLSSKLKSDFEITVGSRGGSLFAASESAWVKEQCASKGVSAQNKLPKIIQSSSSQELINAVPDGGSAFSFMLAAPEPLLRAVANSSKDGATTEQLKHFSSNLPESVLFTQQMPDSLISRINVSISKLPKELHAGLNGDVNPLLKHISDSSILSLSLSGDLLRAAASIPQNDRGQEAQQDVITVKKTSNKKQGQKDSRALESASTDKSLILDQLAPYLNSNKGLSISITSIAAGKMFPGVAIVINDPQADKLKERFKQELPSLLGDSASMLPPFQTKQSGSLKIDYSLTPLGIGLYLASKDDLLIVTSEEELLASLGGESGGSSNSGQARGSILASLEPTFSKELRELKNAVFFNLDFNRLAAAISSAENTASMFTGGKGLVSPEQLRTIKEMGKVSGRITLANGILTLVQSNAYPPQVQ